MHAPERDWIEACCTSVPKLTSCAFWHRQLSACTASALLFLPSWEALLCPQAPEVVVTCSMLGGKPPSPFGEEPVGQLYREFLKRLHLGTPACTAQHPPYAREARTGKSALLKMHIHPCSKYTCQHARTRACTCTYTYTFVIHEQASSLT